LTHLVRRFKVKNRCIWKIWRIGVRLKRIFL